MEYLPAGDLHAYTLDDPARAKSNCELVCTQILKALEIMHGMEICHRDLKPQVRNSIRKYKRHSLISL